MRDSSNTENFLGIKLKKLSIKPIGKFFTKVADKVKKVVGDGIQFAALLPLMPAMLVILTAKKIKVTEHGINAVSKTFYNAVIKGNFQYEYNEQEENFVDDAVAVVKAIVGYFKKIKEKKDAKKGGESGLSKVEGAALDAVATAADSLQNSKFDNPTAVATPAGGFVEAPRPAATAGAGADNKMLIIIGGVAIAAILLMKK